MSILHSSSAQQMTNNNNSRQTGNSGQI